LKGGEKYENNRRKPNARLERLQSLHKQNGISKPSDLECQAIQKCRKECGVSKISMYMLQWFATLWEAKKALEISEGRRV